MPLDDEVDENMQMCQLFDEDDDEPDEITYIIIDDEVDDEMLQNAVHIQLLMIQYLFLYELDEIDECDYVQTLVDMVKIDVIHFSEN